MWYRRKFSRALQNLRLGCRVIGKPVCACSPMNPEIETPSALPLFANLNLAFSAIRTSALFVPTITPS